MSNPSLTLLFLAQQDIPTSHDLLAKALPILRDQLSDVTSASVYRIALDGFVLWSSTQAEQSVYISKDDLPVAVEALDNHSLVQHENISVIPLTQENSTYALLTLEHSSPPSPDTITPLIEQLSLLLNNKQLQESMQRQLLVSRNLADAETLGMIAGLIGMSFLDEGRFITINLFDYDNEGNLLGARSVASANRNESFEQDDIIAVDIEYLQRVRQALTQYEEFLISDVKHDKALRDTDRDFLQSRNITGIYNLPLKNNEQMIGFISIADTRHRIALTPLEKQTFRAISTQAGSIISRRQLLASAQTGLETMQVLYNLTSDITTADGLPDLLQAIYDNIAQDADFATINVMEYDENGQIQNIYIRYTVVDGEVKAVNSPWTKELTPAQKEQAMSYMQDMGDQVEAIYNIEKVIDKYPLLSIVRDMGIRSSLTIPVSAGDRREQQFTLGWRKPHGFDEDLVEMMEAARAQIRLVLSNLSVLEESRLNASRSIEQARLLQRLNDLIATTNREQNEDALLRETANVLLDITDADHIGITLIRTDDDEVQVVAEAPDTGIIGEFIEGHAGGIPQKLRELNAPLLMLDIDGVDFIDERSRQAILSTGSKSAFFVGMFDLQNQLLGTVGFDYFNPVKSFDDNIINLAQTIVAQVAVNLQKLRLLEASQQQAQKMQRITEFSQSMLTSLKFSDIVTISIEASQEILNADYIGILTYDRDQDVLRQVGEFWDDKTTINTPGIMVTGGANNIAYSAWKQRDVVRIDALQSNWDNKHPYLNQLGSLLVAPMVTGGIMFGVMEVGSRQLLGFSDVDVAAFRQLSNQLAVAISNAETYEQSQTLARNKVLANDVISNIQRQTDVQDILRVTIQELGTALGAKRARIRLGFDPSNTNGTGE